MTCTVRHACNNFKRFAMNIEYECSKCLNMFLILLLILPVRFVICK